ncbi:hypothetical protein DSCO28_15630 [Desulfosarcina ovata subsp. sediminis]|uniref:Aromatic hydrocarbon degradation protein n=1 Tax=Desulfosarcina ovata subsp. sediminis TaxID=885957 RepID=A0A5K7ZLS6_9BACT|nr:outer membrane protein transport protein [Desulfosarcina ovata]BBO80997.1 hypothetical protein DSCO28_15630 [Desulfosarcina ovata subsp. sediminis]
MTNTTFYQKWWKIALTILLLCIPPEGTQAYNATRVMSYGARSLGRGGVDIAIADDSTGINTNPAGMSWVDGNMVDINLSILFPDVTMVNPKNKGGRKVKDRLLLAPGVGMIHHDAGRKWAFGVALAAPDALATDYTVTANYLNTDPSKPGTASCQSAFSEWIHLRLSPAVSYAPNDKLSFGARIGVDYMTLDLRAPLGRSYLNLGTTDGFGFSVGIGMQYRPNDRLHIGLTAETQSYMQDLTSRSGDASLKLDVSGLGYPDGTILSFDDMKAEVSEWESAPVIGAGIAFQCTDRLSVGIDFKYYFWSETNDEMIIRFSGGDADAVKAAVGIDRLRIPFKWEDEWALGIGGDYRVTDWMTARLGYNYGKVAGRSNYTTYLAPIIFDHHITLGSTFSFTGFELSWALIHSLKNSESNSNPSGVDESITAQLGGIPIDSELNHLELEGALTTIALQCTWRF